MALNGFVGKGTGAPREPLGFGDLLPRKCNGLGIGVIQGCWESEGKVLANARESQRFAVTIDNLAAWRRDFQRVGAREFFRQPGRFDVVGLGACGAEAPTEGEADNKSNPAGHEVKDSTRAAAFLKKVRATV